MSAAYETSILYYPTVSPADEDWGLYMNVAGSAVIQPLAEYPPPGHPNEYTFTCNKGRILHEFQIIYITNGSGVMETKEGTFEIESGSILLLFPGVWHRYRPNLKTGWTEHYIGFNGIFASQLYRNPILNTESPVLKIGFQEDLLIKFDEVFILIYEGKPGNQQICAGNTIFILGKVISSIRNSEFAGKDIERKIQKACIHLRENLNTNLNMEKFAEDLNLGYSYFRRMFKNYTGLSPNQYYMQLKIKKAKELIMNSEKSIKEISNELGFETAQYFSRIYKKKVGTNPTDLRNKAH